MMSETELTKRLEFYQLTTEALKAARHQHDLARGLLLDFYGVKPNARFIMTRQYHQWYKEHGPYDGNMVIPVGEVGTIADIHSDRLWIAFPECNVPVLYENLHLLEMRNEG